MIVFDMIETKLGNFLLHGDAKSYVYDMKLFEDNKCEITMAAFYEKSKNNEDYKFIVSDIGSNICLNYINIKNKRYLITNAVLKYDKNFLESIFEKWDEII